MSWHDTPADRKPRRLGLYLPFLLLLLGIGAWTLFWFWARGQVQARMDAAVRDLARAGYQISWKRRTIGGFPYRIDVTLDDALVREPSGWGLEAPLLEGEAYAYEPGHWMLAAPRGLTFLRPTGGAVAVAGRTLRASLLDLEKRPPSFDFQGAGLTFRPAVGAEPFALTEAGLVELHLRAGPDDQGGVFVQLTDGRAWPAGAFGRIAGAKPVSLTWNSTLSKMSALSGADWAQAVRRWSDAGGLMSVRDDSRLAAGDALVQVTAGQLSADHDGRLRGTLDVALREASQALGALAAGGALPVQTARAAGEAASARQEGEAARAVIHFQAGQATLGPVALGPAPKVYAAP